MKKVTIYGASDDLVEVEGMIQGADEYNCDGQWQGVLAAPDGSTARVFVDYRDSGVWTVALGQFEEGYALPDWPVMVGIDGGLCGYSTVMQIEVPDGTTLVVGS